MVWQPERCEREFLGHSPSVAQLVRCVLLLVALAVSATPVGVSQSTDSPSKILWSADMATGDLSQWYFPGTSKSGNHGGGVYNSGIAFASASRKVAHNGRYSAKLTITTPHSPTSGTRLFRWAEAHIYPRLCYSVWYYFPRKYSVAKWWNVWQWKSKHAAGNDPFFVLNVGNQADGTMAFYLYDINRQVTYNQSLKSIPVGKWFQVEAFYECAGDNTGHMTFWQDGVQIFDVANVQTRYADGDCQWSVNNYSSGLTPRTATIYIDDAVISTGRLGTGPSSREAREALFSVP